MFCLNRCFFVKEEQHKNKYFLQRVSVNQKQKRTSEKEELCIEYFD